MRRRRITRIRKAIAAGTLAAFVALFAVVYIQMAFGRDPALGGSATPAVIAATADASGEDDTTVTENETAATTPAPVTTSQS